MLLQLVNSTFFQTCCTSSEEIVSSHYLSNKAITVLFDISIDVLLYSRVHTITNTQSSNYYQGEHLVSLLHHNVSHNTW